MARKRKVEKLTFIQRVEAKRAAIYAKRDATLKNEPPRQVPPLDPHSLLNTTRVAGKNISTWEKMIQKRVEEAHKNARIEKTHDDMGERRIPLTVDLTDLPAWVTWAVETWHRMGSPTIEDKVNSKVRDLEDKAENYEKFAALDAAEAAKLLSPKLSEGIRVSNIPEAEKKTKQAQAKLDKAAVLRKEIETLKKELE